jgi:hypothetical protein
MLTVQWHAPSAVLKLVPHSHLGPGNLKMHFWHPKLTNSITWNPILVLNCPCVMLTMRMQWRGHDMWGRRVTVVSFLSSLPHRQWLLAILRFGIVGVCLYQWWWPRCCYSFIVCLVSSMKGRRLHKEENRGDGNWQRAPDVSHIIVWSACHRVFNASSKDLDFMLYNCQKNLGRQKCILRVPGPKWERGTSSWTANDIFSSASSHSKKTIPGVRPPPRHWRKGRRFSSIGSRKGHKPWLFRTCH